MKDFKLIKMSHLNVSIQQSILKTPQFKIKTVSDVSLKLNDQNEIEDYEVVNAAILDVREAFFAQIRWDDDSDSSSDGYVENDCGLM